MRVVSLSAVALALGALAVPASAQVAGLPVNYAPVPTGVTVHGTFGRGLNDNSGKANTIGGGVTLGLPTFQVGAAASYFDLDGAKDISFGGHGMFSLPLPPATPVSIGIVAGVGIVSQDIPLTTESVTTIFVPAGAVLSIDVPSPTLDVTPWISPQFRYSRTGSVGTLPSTSNSSWGVSGGLSLGLPMGLGFHVLGDYDGNSEAFLVGGGVHFSVAVPSLGVPGM